MTPDQPYVELWRAVVAAAINEHRALIKAARAGKRRLTFGGVHYTVNSISGEIGNARRYFESEDFRIVCERAGIGIRLDRIMRYVTADDATVAKIKRSAGIGEERAAA